MRFLIRNEGTITLIQPCDEAAENWIEEHVDVQSTWGGATVVEHRYVTPILIGIAEAGGEIGIY